MNIASPRIAVVDKELAVAWEDGLEQYLSLKRVREACPCAICAGEPDVMGHIAPSEQKKLTPESFVMKSYQFVGGYGLQFFWGDGHSSGIYSFQYLRNLSHFHLRS